MCLHIETFTDTKVRLAVVVGVNSFAYTNRCISSLFVCSSTIPRTRRHERVHNKYNPRCCSCTCRFQLVAQNRPLTVCAKLIVMETMHHISFYMTRLNNTACTCYIAQKHDLTIISKKKHKTINRD